jgi:CubicO group peptidase (beta-lactamase class C family)
MLAEFFPTDLDIRVARAREESGTPGLTFAASLHGRATFAASGVVNIETGIEARPDSLFQVGSITKSLTATLILQAAEEGLLDIDAPVSACVSTPLGVGKHSGQFTARQLMAHLSGLDGDLFTDTGRDDDALAKYMVLCADLEFISPPGRYYNYCNAGYAILGRMLEVVRGKSYDRVLRDHLLTPLGATRSTTYTEEAAFARTAVGHVPGHDGAPALAPPIELPRALGPAGFSLYSTVQDLVTYANAHMAGEKPVSLLTAAAMRTAHSTLVDQASWGLGWKLISRDGVDFVGHDGGTIGQSAYLWTVPEQGLAIAMCTNGGRARIAWESLAFPLFRDVCGQVPEVTIPSQATDQFDLSPYEGVFENLGVVLRITAKDGGLTAVASQKAFDLPDIIFHMLPLGGGRFRATIGDDSKVVVAFLEHGPDGRPELFYAGRLHRRVKS